MVNDNDDRENRNENRAVAKGEDRYENGKNRDEALSNRKGENDNYKSSSVEYDLVARLSKFMKGKTFIYVIDGKINFEVGQVFESVKHFRKVLDDYNI